MKISRQTVNILNIMSYKRAAPDSPITPSKQARKVLNLCDKIKVIEAIKGGLSHWSAATKFGVGSDKVCNVQK